MSDGDQNSDHRRHPRFQFGGPAVLVFDDKNARRTIAVTNYRNISQRGACIVTPDINGFIAGDRMSLMSGRYRRQREAVVVDFGTGRLHLEIPESQELSEFEVAEILEKINQVDAE